MNYECHITVDPKDAEAATLVAAQLRWVVDACQLTVQSDNLPDILRRMDSCDHLLWAHKVKVLRKKLERIIFDERMGN